MMKRWTLGKLRSQAKKETINLPWNIFSEASPKNTHWTYQESFKVYLIISGMDHTNLEILPVGN